jgi:microcystin-dependent protein
MTTRVSSSTLANTAVTTGTYGGASQIPVVVVDQQGRLTSAANVSVTVTATQITGLTGEIKMWPTVTAPTGYLICNGAAVSRTTYATLFGIIGTTFGPGDTTSTFNLPDFRDRMPIGAGTTYSANTSGGSADAVAVSHTHSASTSISDPGHFHTSTWNNANDFNQGGYSPGAEAAPDDIQGTFTVNTDSKTTGITASTSITSSGVSGTNANLPPYRGIYFIIKHA